MAKAGSTAQQGAAETEAAGRVGPMAQEEGEVAATITASGNGQNERANDMAKAGSTAALGERPGEADSRRGKEKRVAKTAIEGLSDGLPGEPWLDDEGDSPPAVPRDRKGRFLKGQSGNPSGRPKTDPKVKRILKAATADAAKLLADIVVDEGLSMNIRVDCAKEILNRVYGRSTQIVDAGVDSTIRLLLSPEAEPYAG